MRWVLLWKRQGKIIAQTFSERHCNDDRPVSAESNNNSRAAMVLNIVRLLSRDFDYVEKGIKAVVNAAHARKSL